jgi:uncharacterized protein
MIGLYPVQSTSLETGCCGGAENMESQEFEPAAAYALGRLESELSPALSYHSVDHTNADVVPAATRLAADEGIEGNDLRNLVTAAWFHDLGFIEQRTGHEGVGARIASAVLPGFGYTDDDVAVVTGIIMATVLPQSPTTLLEQIMADADLDLLGREDFLVLNGKLRGELANFGETFTDEEWFRAQLAFVAGHTYFTAAARNSRDGGQTRNREELQRALTLAVDASAG